MPESIQLTILHLNDAEKLRLAGIETEGNASRAAIREKMRRLQELCGRQVWLACLEDGSILAVAGFQMIDPDAGRAVLHLRTGAYSIREAVIRAILRKALYDLDIYRLELAMETDSAENEAIFAASGWTREAVLQNAAYHLSTQRHHDVVLYSILRPDFRENSTVFISFSRGLFAVTGTSDIIKSTDFIRYGARFRQVGQRESAEKLDLLDQDGKLPRRGEVARILGSRPYFSQDSVPELLQKAAQQAIDYFAGRSTAFNLPLDLGQGTDFQVKVWQKLPDIPYGATWTYEELAISLAMNERTDARKLSRAVGSACGANPFPLLLPCHRVIGKDGKLVGFSSGLEIKEYLLAHEIMGLIE